MADEHVVRMTETLVDRITHLPVVDTHEHMTMESTFVAGSYDFVDLMTYVYLDLWVAGYPAGAWGAVRESARAGGTVAEKWARIKPFWPYVRTGCYGRAYRRMLKLFFDVDDLDDRTVQDVSRRIAEYQYRGVYGEHLRDRHGIRVMLQAQGYEPTPEPEHFAAIYRFSELAGAYSAEAARQALGADLPADFGEFRAMVQDRVATAAANGAVGLKIGMTARQRGLEFMQPWDGRPTGLIPSLVEFPETKFLIFHGSYPYMAELTGLAKSFHNVYLDLAWFHLLSRYQARAWLAEWLDVLPHNKLFAFGGDVLLFFGICSHLQIARENVAAVLTERVVDGLCDVDEAEHTARRLFHDNAWATFKLENWQGQASGGHACGQV